MGMNARAPTRAIIGASQALRIKTKRAHDQNGDEIPKISAFGRCELKRHNRPTLMRECHW